MAQATENTWWSSSPEEKKRTVQDAWAATLMDDLDMRDDQDDDVAVAYGVPASKQAIIDLCVPTWGEAKENEDHGGCVVCLEGLGIDQQLRMMPCKHTFHKLCIFKWLVVNRLCPICQFALPSDQECLQDQEEAWSSDAAAEEGIYYRPKKKTKFQS
ncbi:hypothetical protein HU200_050745 [Digitaria exilis]|uniref:RING-type domain-containing protein n=1 Tax=Digitaria exilis TaxID=1010633 RepID=A0A835ANJ8_9POAL|nr:hypothetical protein HU200_050745 [Digitaria exilis]